MLRAAVPLKEIGDVLGHRSAASTAAYLKLATEDLRSVALEVPAEVKA
jgi:site-specific recombinase XerD